MAWKSQQDFERDLLLFAEYSVPTPEDEREMREMPDCIREYYNQMERNQRAGNRCEDLDEGATYVIHSGRGRGMGRRLMKPGQDIEHDPNDDIELRKKIREVAGLGFSNKLIEQQFKNLHLREEQETYKDSTVVGGPNLKWDDPQSSSSTATTVKSAGSTSGSSSPSRSANAGDGDAKKSHHQHRKTPTTPTAPNAGDVSGDSGSTPTKSTSNSGKKSNQSSSESGGKGKTHKKSFSSAASSTTTAGMGDAYFTATSNSSSNSVSDGSEGHYDKDFPKIDLDIKTMTSDKQSYSFAAQQQKSQGYHQHHQQRSPPKRAPRGPYNKS